MSERSTLALSMGAYSPFKSFNCFHIPIDFKIELPYPNSNIFGGNQRPDTPILGITVGSRSQTPTNFLKLRITTYLITLIYHKCLFWEILVNSIRKCVN